MVLIVLPRDLSRPSSGASAAIQPFVINFTLSWTTIFTLPDRVRRIYQVLGLPTLRGRTQTQPPSLPPSMLQGAATSASCRPPGNRLSSVSLENCPPYFYHITSFLSHLPLLPRLDATITTTIATITATTTTTTITTTISFPRFLASLPTRRACPSFFAFTSYSRPLLSPLLSSSFVFISPSISTDDPTEVRSWLTAATLRSLAYTAILLAYSDLPVFSYLPLASLYVAAVGPEDAADFFRSFRSPQDAIRFL